MFKNWNSTGLGAWIILIFFLFPVAGAQAAREMTYSLPDNVWRQISLPLAPEGGDTVQAVFGDDLPSGEYGSSWIVFSYDARNHRYVRLDLSDALESGAGYWIFQRTGSTVVLDIAGAAPRLSSPREPACPDSAAGCFRSPLATAGSGLWNMPGYPFADATTWNRLVISTDAGACAAGCSPSAAGDAGIVSGVGYHYNGASYDVLENDAPLSAWTGYWVAALPGAQGLNPGILAPARGGGSEVDFSDEQHLIADQIISIFENGTPRIQYAYAEHIPSDLHGITAGRAGFTSATGDMLMVVERYTQRKPDNPLSVYIPELRRLERIYIDNDYELSEEGANVDNLGGLVEAWARAADDAVFRAVQDEVTNELYFDPVLAKARDLGVSDPLTLLCLYDAAIQHGYDGMLDMVARISEPRPGDGGDETAWLRAFNRIRLDVMENTIVDGERIWADTTYRVHELEDMIADGNTDLHPFTMVIEDWEGETFVLPDTDIGQDRVVASYFVEWGIYGRDYHVSDIPVDRLNHILYAFIAICGPNESLRRADAQSYQALQQQCSDKQDYQVTIHDRYAALEKTYPGDAQDDPVRGNFGQLARLKASHPDLRILPSIGGWTLSDPFFALAANPAYRQRFVDSAIAFLRKYDFFDGVDIDWEYPGGDGANPDLGSESDAENYGLLMRDLRAALDALSAETGKTYELTSAIGTGPARIGALDYGAIQAYIDHFFMMTYDYYGAWDGVLGHHTGLYAGSAEKRAGSNVNDSVSAMLDQGVEPSKLIVGVAQYGRGWNAVSGMNGGDFSNATGGGPMRGTWQDGILDYKAIASQYFDASTQTGLGGFEYFYDEAAEAPYLYNRTTREFITFDNPRSVEAKGRYVLEHRLGGLFSWEIDADNGDLVDAMNRGLAR